MLQHETPVSPVVSYPPSSEVYAMHTSSTVPHYPVREGSQAVEVHQQTMEFTQASIQQQSIDSAQASLQQPGVKRSADWGYYEQESAASKQARYASLEHSERVIPRSTIGSRPPVNTGSGAQVQYALSPHASSGHAGTNQGVVQGRPQQNQSVQGYHQDVMQGKQITQPTMQQQGVVQAMSVQHPTTQRQVIEKQASQEQLIRQQATHERIMQAVQHQEAVLKQAMQRQATQQQPMQHQPVHGHPVGQQGIPNRRRAQQQAAQGLSAEQQSIMQESKRRQQIVQQENKARQQIVQQENRARQQNVQQNAQGGQSRPHRATGHHAGGAKGSRPVLKDGCTQTSEIGTSSQTGKTSNKGTFVITVDTATGKTYTCYLPKDGSFFKVVPVDWIHRTNDAAVVKQLGVEDEETTTAISAGVLDDHFRHSDLVNIRRLTKLMHRNLAAIGSTRMIARSLRAAALGLLIELKYRKSGDFEPVLCKGVIKLINQLVEKMPFESIMRNMLCLPAHSGSSGGTSSADSVKSEQEEHRYVRQMLDNCGRERRMNIPMVYIQENQQQNLSKLLDELGEIKDGVDGRGSGGSFGSSVSSVQSASLPLESGELRNKRGLIDISKIHADNCNNGEYWDKIMKESMEVVDAEAANAASCAAQDGDRDECLSEQDTLFMQELSGVCSALPTIHEGWSGVNVTDTFFGDISNLIGSDDPVLCLGVVGGSCASGQEKEQASGGDSRGNDEENEQASGGDSCAEGQVVNQETGSATVNALFGMTDEQLDSFFARDEDESTELGEGGADAEGGDEGETKVETKDSEDDTAEMVKEVQGSPVDQGGPSVDSVAHASEDIPSAVDNLTSRDIVNFMALD